MTLMDVADAARVSVAYLNKVENQQMFPTRAYVAKVVDVIAKGMGDTS
jgi:predicted transcriptional regulator